MKIIDRARGLRPLTPADCARAAGGYESASTSTSGTPSAGDDTIGDSFKYYSPPGDGGGHTWPPVA